MEAPYRYRKKLVKIGNSTCVIIPSGALVAWKEIIKANEVRNVILEVYKNRIVITPIK